MRETNAVDFTGNQGSVKKGLQVVVLKVQIKS